MIDLYCQDIKFHGIQAIVFDKDGTLADSRGYLIQLAQRRAAGIEIRYPGLATSLLRSWGLEPDYLNPAGLMAVGTRFENEVATAAYIAAQGQPWVETLAWVQQVFMEVGRQMPPKAPHTPLFEGTLEMLNQLSLTPVRLGLLSADSQVYVDEFVQHYGLELYLQGWAGTDDRQFAKPNPAALDRLCRFLAVEVSRTVVVGDSLVDGLLARNSKAAGFISVADAWGVLPVPEADARLSKWSDLFSVAMIEE